MPEARFNLELSKNTKRTIVAIKKATDATSMSEVVRRAIAVYGALVSVRTHGGRIIVKQRDSEVEIELLLT